MNNDVGARRFIHVAFGMVGEQDSSHDTNSVSRSDWKLVIPPTELDVEFQFTPIEGSPAPRPMYSTVNTPELVAVPGVRIPGASKFS